MRLFHDPQSFAKVISEGGKLCGLDLCPRRIGLSISDSHRRIATPFSIIFNAHSKLAIAQKEFKVRTCDHGIISRLKAENVIGWIVGLPVPLSTNQDNFRVRDTYVMLQSLHPIIGANSPILLHDERFSSVMARIKYNEVHGTLARDYPRSRDIFLDDFAAAHILQEFLDYILYSDQKIK